MCRPSHPHLEFGFVVVTTLNQPHFHLRTDIVDDRRRVTLRYLGQLRHLNVDWAYRGQRNFLCIVDEKVEVVSEEGELIGEITLDSDRDYHPINRNPIE
jgi:hypothetical protein